MPNRTNRALLTALVTALLLWFAASVVRTAAIVLGMPVDASDLLAPAATVDLLVTGSSSLGLDDVLAVVVLVGVLAALALPGLRATRAGTAARVLAVWFATIVAGWAAGVAGLLASEDVRRVLASGVREAGVTLLAFGWFEPVRAGWGWGVAYGWIVGLVSVAVARRGAGPAPTGRPAGALAAAVVAGAVSTIGWVAVATAHVRIVELVESDAMAGPAELGAWVPVAADWALPVTTSEGATTGLVVLSGLLVGGVVGTLVWLAVRGTALVGGRLVLFLGVWAAAIVGAALGAVPTVLAAPEEDRDATWSTGLLFQHGTDGGASGALYGWIPALLVLAVLTLAQRRVPPAAEPVAAQEPAPSTA